MHTEDVIRIVDKVTSRMRARLNTMISRVVINAISDGSGVQKVSGDALKGEGVDEIEHMQPGGLTHVALPGAEGVLFCVRGSRAIPIALGIANRGARPKDLAPGETAMYIVGGSFAGLRVYCKADGTVHVGGETASDAAALASKTAAELQVIVDAIKGAATVPTDGGAAFKTNIIALLNDPVGDVSSTTLKVEEIP